MKESSKGISLLQKTSKTFLLISLSLMMLSTIVLYFYVHKLLTDEVEEELRSTEARIESVIKSNNPIYQLPPVVEVKKGIEKRVERLKDTLIFDPSQNEIEEFRELTIYSTINGESYQITVRTLVVESRDILIAVILSYLVIILFVFLFLFYLNKAGNRKLWAPFFMNLTQMKNFSVTSETPISLIKSDILEFTDLNYEITTLTQKVRTDYKNLKQYTEDVSHEIQTPLAIIKAKIENIINSDNLNNFQFEHLNSIQKDLQRLTQLNKGLTLLTKIENRQFLNSKELSFNDIVRQRIENFLELFPLEINIEDDAVVFVKMDPYLADVLCDNLLSNALKYSTTNEAVHVVFIHKTFIVSNYGENAVLHPEKLFDRFYKESEHKKSTGLGLAIVKKISDLYGLKVQYHFEKNRHHFVVSFP
ncbi:sensor histidine kinase [Cellulophaga baltica]|uniref:sensor histidine kinase n=1 Tax=Cellulophaga baltica TaxID=76594 RepID=UPI0037CA4998